MSAIVLGAVLLTGVQLQGVVRDPAGFRRALARARPGQTIQLAPGMYRGGIEIRDLDLDPVRPVLVKAQHRSDPPRIVGGDVGLHLVNVRGIQIEGLQFTDQQEAAIRVERSGGRVAVSEVRLVDLRVERGRGVGVDLLGLEDFALQNLNVSDWTSDKPAVQVRGSTRGIIDTASITGTSGSGIALVGGTRDVRVRRTVIRGLSGIGIRLGDPFVTSDRGFQVRGIQIEGCQILRTGIGVQFDDADGVDVMTNTIYDSREAALRFAGSIASGNRQITIQRNIFAQEGLTGSFVQVSEGFVEVSSIRMDQNVWFRPGSSEASRPGTPWPDRDAIHGVDPQFNDPVRNDFGLRAGSPAVGRGHSAYRG